MAHHISADQLCVDRGPGWARWNIEQDDGVIVSAEANKSSTGATTWTYELVECSEENPEDWIGTETTLKAIRAQGYTLPYIFFS